MVNGISVRKATVEDLIEWNSYAAAHNDASAYHHYAWIQAIKNAYKHENASVLARDTATNKLVGIFPAVELQIPLLGKSLCSLPYCDIGHGLAENQEIYDAMLSHIQRSISEEKKPKFEVRAADTKTTDSDLLKNKKVRMLLDLPSSSEALMASFKSKLRSQIKKAEKNGLTVSLGIEDHHILHFYDVYSKNMRDLGSPVHSIKWFREIVAAYQEQCLISVVYENDEPIGGGLIIKSGSEASIPWASTLRERNKLAPNMLLYWSLLAHCADNDVTRFDFGRSTFNEGTYKFKKQWGAKPQLLNWHTFNATSTVTSEKESNAGSPNKLRTIAEHIWRKLPLRITIAIGAAVRPYISL
ncbi:hypothetical protein AMBAS45_13665 [Alteromonas macleodii str. 'Balearic Sea AD45']|nr:hypothetical protein AMBAS45_13665 [Alteromonas macleodii str. 'Balearic Sea AD45']